MNSGPARDQDARTAGQPSLGTSGTPEMRQEARAIPLQVDSHSLLQGRNTLIIAHQGELYRLQLTRQGKLILTK